MANPVKDSIYKTLPAFFMVDELKKSMYYFVEGYIAGKREYGITEAIKNWITVNNLQDDGLEIETLRTVYYRMKEDKDTIRSMFKKRG